MQVIAKFERRVAAVDSLLCVGLDSAFERIPERFRSEAAPQFAFNRYIIEQTHAFASAFKPNIAFYEARGARGLADLQLTLDYLRERHPDIVTICDAKRGDNTTTNQAYAHAIFDQLGFDAVTLQPYMGRQVLEPFLERADKGCIILCRTSNPGDAELQELPVHDAVHGSDKPLWQVVAEKVRDDWNARGNCMLVVGATLPRVLGQVRLIVGDMPILAPGVGAQGADLELATQAAVDANGRGVFLSASRSVIFHEDPAGEARALRDAINRYRAATR
jgi:orotidine-5'-phosphate decarboxylase